MKQNEKSREKIDAKRCLSRQLRGIWSVGSPSVTLRGLMRNDVLLLLNGSGGQVHSRRWYQHCMDKAARGLALTRHYEVFR
jgi:hypothetical protein